MAIPSGHRFDIAFDSAFPQGLVLIGGVTPDNEYQTREDKAAGRPVRQKLDQVTGKRQWKATVTDPDEPNAKRASFGITFVADVQPVPATTEVLPGMRPIELDGLTAEPRVAGNGEFKYQSYVYRATGFTAQHERWRRRPGRWRRHGGRSLLPPPCPGGRWRPSSQPQRHSRPKHATTKHATEVRHRLLCERLCG